MSTKKKKDLADELINDLLNDEDHGSSFGEMSEVKSISVVKNSLEDNEKIESEKSLEDQGSFDGRYFDFNTLHENQDKTHNLNAQNEDKTLNLSEKKTKVEAKAESHLASKTESTVPLRHENSNVFRVTSNNFAETALAQTENLKIAQQRILNLEKQLQSLRKENHDLALAGDMIQKKHDKSDAELKTLQSKYFEEIENYKEERKLLKQTLSFKDAEISELSDKTSALEDQLQQDIHRVRMRERELENRLELLKVENSTLLKTKNETILDLKRSIDQLNLELESFRNRGQELNKKLENKQEALRRTVKTLRLALAMLEGSDDEIELKKA